jgi:hydrogenase maturation protease
MNDVLVLGVGNTLWADEGVGPAIIGVLADSPEWNAVELVDGGTRGLYLLPYLQAAKDILVFDAVDFDDPPGSVTVLRDDEIPAFFGQRPLSLHQTSFMDVLAAAELTGHKPQRISLVGIQYQDIDAWCGPLSAAVKSAMPTAIALGKRELQSWTTTGI